MTRAAADRAAAPTTVVFDVGHVLVDWNPRAYYAPLVEDEAVLDYFLGAVATGQWHAQHDAGRPFAETSAELIARHPEHEALIRRWGERFHEMVGPVLPGMREIVRDLAARGVPLYAITNFSHEFWAPFAAREAALFAPFRDIVVSGAERLVKPDPAIFALAIARFGIDPGTALFVDDRPENVAAAEAAGLVGHLFTGAEPLRAALHGWRLV